MTRPFDAARPSITLLAGLLALGVILSLARAILIPIALAILLAFTLSPAVVALQRRGVWRTPAVLLVAGAALVLVGGAVVALSFQLHTLAGNLPEHKENILRKLRELFGHGPGVLERLSHLFEEISAGIQPPTAAAIPVTVTASHKSALEALRETTGSLVGWVGSVSLVIGLTLAMLFKREDLRNRLIRLAGHGELTSTTRALDEATRRISGYLQIQLAVNASFGFVFGLGMAILGVPYPLLWGFLAFVVRFVPLIGTWLAALFPLVISFATSAAWFQPLAVVAFALILGLLVNNIVEPLLISRSTGVSPVGLVVAAAFWTWLWGITGLVLSTPITVCLAVLGRFVPPLEFLDVLFGTDPALDPRDGYYQRLLAHDEVEAGEILAAYLKEHSPAELCDLVLLPALVRAKEEANLGRLSAEELNHILAATAELTDDLDGRREEARSSGNPACTVIGYPAKDAVDEMGLALFQKVWDGAPLQALSIKNVAAELIEAVRHENSTAVLIAALHPGGLAKIRYLAKRLRAAFPRLRLHVGYWGLPLTDSKLQQQLAALGVDEVATTMSEALRQLDAFVRVAPHLAPVLANGAPAGAQ
ncbi:MAG: AI-2E family transporter [Gemmataceae bacterium]